MAGLSADGEVIARICAGEIDDYQILVKKYLPRVTMFVRSRVRGQMDTEDIVQNAFINAYKALPRFDKRREFYPWILAIAHREIAQFFRRNPTHVPLTEELIGGTDPWAQSNDLVRLVGTLSGPYRRVLQLQLTGYHYSEIARRLGRPIGTVRTMLRRAKLALREKYEGNWKS